MEALIRTETIEPSSLVNFQPDILSQTLSLHVSVPHFLLTSGSKEY